MKYTIEKIIQKEADVTVKYPSGRTVRIPGNEYIEWHIVQWKETDNDRFGMTVAWCRTEELAKKIQAALSEACIKEEL